MAASFLASVTKTESSTDDAQQMLLAPTPIYITDDDVRLAALPLQFCIDDVSMRL
jgi:hypothetical protein